MLQTRDTRKPPDIGIPARTRDRQHRPDSLDIDDVMNGSDDKGYQGTNQNSSPPATQRIGRAQYPVSAHTRDLMAFLDEGPPEPKLSQSGSELLDFLARGPPEYADSATILDPSKTKGAGRLQRMISKLSLGGDKVKAGSETTRPPPYKQPSSPARSTISTKPSVTTISSLANRPIPPRPNPVSSSSSRQYSHDEGTSIRTRDPLHNSHQDIPSSRETPSTEKAAEPVAAPSPLDMQETRPLVNGNEQPAKDVSSEPQQPVSPIRTISRMVVPPPRSASLIPFFTETDAKDMQSLLVNASTADECRLIFDMFMARNRLGSAPETGVPSSPSPLLSVIKPMHAPLLHDSVGETSIESTLVEFFLSGTAMPDVLSGVLSEQKQPEIPIERHPVTSAAANLLSPSSRPPLSIPLQTPLPS